MTLESLSFSQNNNGVTSTMLLLRLAILTLVVVTVEVLAAPQYPLIRNGFLQHRLNHYGQGFKPGPPRYVSIPRGLQTFGMHTRVRESPTMELIFAKRFEGDSETRPIVLVDEPAILLIDQEAVTIAVGEETTTSESGTEGSTTGESSTEGATTEGVDEDE